jgi:hypothetical protein
MHHMSALSRRSLVTSAATLPALAVPAVAVAATDPNLLALGERLRALFPKERALGVKFHQLSDECKAGLPIGFMQNKNCRRIHEIRSKRNGRDRTWAEWDAATDELNEIAGAILEIPATDRIGEGIPAAAALALDEDDCDNGHNMRALLWDMAERAGFDRSTCKTVQS